MNECGEFELGWMSNTPRGVQTRRFLSYCSSPEVIGGGRRSISLTKAAGFKQRMLPLQRVLHVHSCARRRELSRPHKLDEFVHASAMTSQSPGSSRVHHPPTVAADSAPNLLAFKSLDLKISRTIFDQHRGREGASLLSVGFSYIQPLCIQSCTSIRGRTTGFQMHLSIQDTDPSISVHQQFWPISVSFLTTLKLEDCHARPWHRLIVSWRCIVSTDTLPTPAGEGHQWTIPTSRGPALLELF